MFDFFKGIQRFLLEYQISTLESEKQALKAQLRNLPVTDFARVGFAKPLNEVEAKLSKLKEKLESL